MCVFVCLSECLPVSVYLCCVHRGQYSRISRVGFHKPLARAESKINNQIRQFLSFFPFCYVLGGNVVESWNTSLYRQNFFQGAVRRRSSSRVKWMNESLLSASLLFYISFSLLFSLCLSLSLLSLPYQNQNQNCFIFFTKYNCEYIHI